MTYDECMVMAARLGIPASDLRAVLWFLHYRIGILLYYPEVDGFDKVVICDIQVWIIIHPLRILCMYRGFDKIHMMMSI